MSIETNSWLILLVGHASATISRLKGTSAAGRPYLENNQALLYNLFNSLLFAYERGAIHPCKTQIQ